MSKLLKISNEARATTGSRLIDPIPNGFDYLAFSRPRDEEDRTTLLKAGSGITQADFHQIMLSEGWRKHYLMNFLQTERLKNNPSPIQILSRLKDNEINLVTTPVTHLLTSKQEPSQLVVLMGLHFIDAQNTISWDPMKDIFAAMGPGDFEFVKPEIIQQMHLIPGLIEPQEVLPHNELVDKLFPGGKSFQFTNQAQELMRIISTSEIILPSYLGHDHLKNANPGTTWEFREFFQEQFRTKGWQVLG